jgi:3-hydroxyacyl-CoA dehydrogenase/enoyl-CoA hydratase/3-hydroxybutyryl-CoA epimerase/enoyl-CoA isomerase
MFQGKTLRLQPLHGGFIELCFAREGESVNKLDKLTLGELRQALQWLRADGGVRGLMLTSAKDAFIVGADIYEFGELFKLDQRGIATLVRLESGLFTQLAQLPFPTVAALNGLALGGGFEATLACDARVAADAAKVGLPEVTLGLIPGYGGSVRLPRLAGGATALQWITRGAPQSATQARAAGAVDAVVPAAELRAAALDWLQQAAAGRHDWQARRAALEGPVALDAQALEQARQLTAGTARHYPAAAAFVDLLERTAGISAQAALMQEAQEFARLCKTPTAAALVRLFVNDQFLKKKARGYVQQARALERAAVLGAGIMGGGIACTSAARGTPVLLKDISESALALGMAEAGRLLDKQVASGRMPAAQAAQVQANIQPQRDYAGFDGVDIVVEAIVENLAVKKKVLAEVEALVREGTVIASNTSSLPIADMASALRRPGNFAGMHFFNPVPQMPLVEVIRGPQTDPVAAATIAGYAVAMGKTPVMVKDGPGFLVNRILMPYLLAFLRLVHDGADFRQVDRVMEDFGWPMGPAYLSDVIGLDTLVHVLHVITRGHAPRMRPAFPLAVEQLLEHKRLGQKSGSGFYRHGHDTRGKPTRQDDDTTAGLLAAIQPQGPRAFSDQDIVDRLMLPLVLEAARCLEEGVADSAVEVDMSLVLGIGFPRHLGGALHWADSLGLAEVVRRCGALAGLSPLYAPSPGLQRLAAAGGRFHAA